MSCRARTSKRTASRSRMWAYRAAWVRSRCSKRAAQAQRSGSERHFYPSLSQALGSRLHAVFQRETMAFSRGLGGSMKHWILEASNILPGTKKALHLCKALIYLVFLAPRPGLEPGTYGLTGYRSICPLTRMNAHFPGFALPIFLVRFTSGRPGKG